MQRSGISRGIGCAAILPAAMVGLAGLMDGAGPTGWRGFAEVFGWCAWCLVAVAIFTILLDGGRGAGPKVLSCMLAIVVGAGVLAYRLLNWLIWDASMTVKVQFTSVMQALGAIAAGACAFLIVGGIWRRLPA